MEIGHVGMGDINFFSIFQTNSQRIKCEFAAYGTDIVANRMTFVWNCLRLFRILNHFVLVETFVF